MNFAVVSEDDDVALFKPEVFVQAHGDGRVVCRRLSGLADGRCLPRHIIELLAAFAREAGERDRIPVLRKIGFDIALIGLVVIRRLAVKRGALVGEQFVVNQIQFRHDRELGQNLTENVVDGDRHNVTLSVAFLVFDHPAHQLHRPGILHLHDDLLIVPGILQAGQLGHLNQGFEQRRISLSLGFIPDAGGTRPAFFLLPQQNDRLGLFNGNVIQFLNGVGVALPDNDRQAVPRSVAGHKIIDIHPAEAFLSGFSFQCLLFPLQRVADPVPDFLLHRISPALDQDHHLLSLVAVKHVVDDFRRAGVPVQDNGMSGDLQLPVAGICRFDKVGNIVGDISDDGAGEDDHAEDDDRYAGDDDRHAGIGQILDHQRHVAGIQNHADSVIDGRPEAPVL